MENTSKNPLVGVLMGSDSDKEVMWEAIEALIEFQIPHEYRVISAHRSPGLLLTYAQSVRVRGLKFIIAGAGGSAHLPGVTAALTNLPVHGVPIPSASDPDGHIALHSMIQMPPGVPVAVFGVGKSGARNSALHAIRALALESIALQAVYEKFVERQAAGVTEKQQPSLDAYVVEMTAKYVAEMKAKRKGDAV